jgi:hypothetical protein
MEALERSVSTVWWRPRVTKFFLTNGANYNNNIATLDPRTAQLALRLEF